MRNGEFTQVTIKSLYKRAGEHCSICKKLTSKPHTNPEKFHNLGEAAHIHGLKNSPNLRFTQLLSLKQLAHINNGLWLCLSCHHEIDSDSDKFTADHLRQIKNEHEKLVARLHETGNGFLPTLTENEYQIARLEDLINTKERLIQASERSFDLELNKLRFELDSLKKENSLLISQLKEIQKDVFDINDPKLNTALLNKNGVDEALLVLDEPYFEKQELHLAKSRLLRGRLLTTKGLIEEAEAEFEKAFKIYPCTNVALAFISFLVYFKLDFEKAVSIAAETFALENNPAMKAELLGQQAQATLTLQRHEEARLLLEKSKAILEENYPHDRWAIEQIAKLEKHIGDCHKMNLKYEEALKCYERALNIYFAETVRGNDNITVMDLAGLSTAIGLLYEQNNKEEEAIIHHLQAVNVLEGVKDIGNTKALIYMNVAACYLQRKTFNINSALSFAQNAHDLLIETSKTRPRDTMEYLLGAKCLLGDIHQGIDNESSEKYYADSLKLVDTLTKINPIFLRQKMHILNNYAVFCLNAGRKDKALGLIDRCISLLKTTSTTLLDRTVGLTRALAVKLDISETVEQRKEILHEIVEVNKDTPRAEKSFAFKLMAEKLLAELEQ